MKNLNISDNKTVRVGVACWVFNPYRLVLMGRRLSPHGMGTWAVPGGHLEFGEEPKHAAMRELLEETNIPVPEQDFHLFAVTNDIFPDKHYITLHYRADNINATPKLMEPNKCEKWMWFDMKALPAPLFLSTQTALAHLRK